MKDQEWELPLVRIYCLVFLIGQAHVFFMTFLKNQSWNMTCGADINPYEDRHLGNMILWTPYVSKPFSITWSTVAYLVNYPFIIIIFFGHGRSPCRILVPWPRIEPRPQQWVHWVITTGPPGIPEPFVLYIVSFYFIVLSWLQSYTLIYQDSILYSVCHFQNTLWYLFLPSTIIRRQH